MAVTWKIKMSPLSTEEDLVAITELLTDQEEEGFDLEHMAVSDGKLITIYKKKP